MPPVDPNAPPRWDLVHARAVAALAEIFANRRDAQKIVRKALRPEWFGPEGAPETPGWAGDARGGGVNNAERAAIADAVLGVEVLRLNLAYLVLERSRSAYEDTLRAAGGPEAFGARALHAILREQGVAVSPSSSPSSPPPAPDRAAYRAAAAAMLALYWMTHRVVSNEFARDYLAVLRGGAKLTGDDWPVDPDDAFAVETSVPRWLAARLRAKFGDEDARKLCAEMRRRAPVTIRRNARVCSSAGDLRDALDAEGVATSTLEAATLAEHLKAASTPSPSSPSSPSPSSPSPSFPKHPPCAGAPDALVFTEGRPRAGVFGLATYRAGWFEVQDAGSQCIASAVADAVLDAAAAERAAGKPSRLWKVLDLCAGNGGKALAVASRLAGARATRDFAARLISRCTASTSTSGDCDIFARRRHARGVRRLCLRVRRWICARWRIWAAGTTPCSRTCRARPPARCEDFRRSGGKSTSEKPSGTGTGTGTGTSRGDGAGTRVETKVETRVETRVGRRVSTGTWTRTRLIARTRRRGGARNGVFSRERRR